ncbi:MAG: putative metal-binding motif-containing protein [Deltaproteobacteria bacterium]|nr:putative metal-binding motif-containing protein [Deltaproteobacteria bacterium]
MIRVLLLLSALLGGCAPNAFYPDEAIDGDQDGVLPTDGDCDDTSAAVAPGLPEVCDGVDNDCDGLVDGDDSELADDDGDGAHDCVDCDDEDATIFDGAPELCDGLDNDCDALVPDDESDSDTDGLRPCEGDCDDESADVSPELAEECDGVDNDCDGLTDEPVPADLAPRVGVAGPGGDLRVWAVDGEALGDPQGLGAPVPSGVVGSAIAVDLDGDGATEWMRQQVDPSDPDADDVASISRTCEGDWTGPINEVVSLGSRSLVVAGGDLDGDGSGDLVSVLLDSVGAGSIFVHLGEGDGEYQLRTTSITIDAVAAGERWAVAPRLIDVNLDGASDLLICAEEAVAAQCRLWIGDGNGGLSGGVVRAVLPMAYDSIDLGDGTGDGVADLFLGLRADDDGRVYMLRGTGGGQFAAPLPILSVSTMPGSGDGVVRVIPGEPRVRLALLWDPQGLGVDRELAIASPERQFWVVGPSSSFTAVAGAPGVPDPLVVSP